MCDDEGGSVYFVIAALLGCHSTIGDPCTASSDCKGDQRCAVNITPTGTGVCTQACASDDDCPGGALCDHTIGLCMAGCNDDTDCSGGLVCNTPQANPFCVPRDVNQGGSGGLGPNNQ